MTGSRSRGVLVPIILAGACAALLVLSPRWTELYATQGYTREESQTGVVAGLLEGDCSGLHGAGTADYGPQLALICGGGVTANASVSFGSITATNSQAAKASDARVGQRMQSRRAGRGADADGWAGGPDTGAASLGTSRLGAFLSFEYERFDKDRTPFESGVASDQFGGTVGTDLMLTDWLLVGVAVNFSRTDGRFDRNGGGFTTDSYGPTLYASFFPLPGLFVDATAGYARKDYEIDRNIVFRSTVDNVRGTARGDTEGDEFRVTVGTGYDFAMENLTAGPRFSVAYTHNVIFGFAERGDTGLELAYDRQHEESLTTSLGVFASLALSTGVGVFVPQVTGEWVHEFLDDQRVIYFRFVQDLLGARFRFKNDPPDRDYFGLGAGLSAILRGGLTPYVNYRAQVGYSDQTTHTVTAGLRISF